MQLRYFKSILPPAETYQKITSLTWAPNNSRLAAVSTDKVVYLFDENGEKRDKFKTKPAEASNPNTYIVRAMAFSPDSTKLAIAQSDNIVFIYRLVDPDTGADKKSICNKFPQACAVTSLVWPKDRPNEVVFGLADGKVRLGMLKNNKSYTCYAHPENSYVVALASSLNGQNVISGHMDGAVWKFNFPAEEGGTPTSSQLVVHSCVPYSLGWGSCIAAAGNDNRVVFYDLNGREIRSFDYGNDDNVREFTTCAFNPSGDTVVFGTYNRFYMYTFNIQRNDWEEVGHKHIENFYAVSAASWKPDGSKLTVGSMTGAVDMYDACVKRHMYKGKFEFTYVSKSAVIVKTLKTGMRIVLKSVYGYEIEKINIYHDRYLVARTSYTLLMGDLESCKLSEIPWESNNTEKFHFENERVCMVHYAGELHIIEYGRNDVLGTCRTEHMNPYLISAVVQEARGVAPESKKLAYLIDLQTVRIQDLMGPVGSTLATVNHDTKVDWLELNQRGTHLLFRDKKRHLHLFNIASQERTTLLNYCQYVQWVPASDVIVAQSRNNLCVWYSINKPDNVTMFPIKGEVIDIERHNHRTEVIVDEGINTVSYALDEALIYFGAALEDQDYERAVQTLEPLELTPETEAQWMQLADQALANNQLVIAERCYAALGDIARTRFLHKVVKKATLAAKELGGDGTDSWSVRAMMAMLNKQWPVAESLLLAQGKVDDAITMYQDHHRWEDAIRVAESAHHPNAASIKQQFLQWLLETSQEEQAGAVKEREGDYLAAIGLYLKGGLPGRAAQVVMSVHNLSWDPALLDSILASLAKAGLYERAGELYEHMGRSTEAMQSYRRGHAYRKAIDLARREFPAEVITIEEEWGDWLVTQKQMDAAINHFIESGATLKAIKAAIDCRQFAKAAGIIEVLDPREAMPYYRRIAQHYETTGALEEAERYYIRADMAREAVEMYSRNNKWEAAQRVARGYLTESEMRAFYRAKAAEFEAAHKLKEAEKAYLAAGGDDVDKAIAMYKRAKMYDHMIRLVTQYRKEKVPEAHTLIAQQLEVEGNLREAEKHFVEAKDWKSAVQMYRQANQWEDALRVAKGYGGINASKQVAYAWALTLGGDEGAQLLKKMGLLDQAIEYAVESGAFAQAFEMTRAGAKHKLPEVHLKYAMFLEDEGRFQEAEAEFIAADKPKEACDMYMHNQDWDAAMRIAERYDPTMVSEILVAQARVAMERKQWLPAEGLFIKAKRPEAALKMYRDARMWNDALRVAEQYLPTKVAEVQMELLSGQGSGGGGPAAPSADAVINKARAFERNNDYARAIEAYLSLTAQDSTNHDQLEHCWEQAAQLAINYQRHRMKDVVNTVSERLQDIGRHQAAGELHESIDDSQGAIRAYCAGSLWDKARSLAGNNPTFVRYIEDQYNSHLLRNQQADELASRGGHHAQQAIEMFMARDEWSKVHELAAQQGPEVAAMYALKHAEKRFKQGDYAQAAAVFAQYGITASMQYFELYRSIAQGVLHANQADRSLAAEKALRDMMYRLVALLRTGGGANKYKADTEAFQGYYLAAHYLYTAALAKEQGLKEIAAMCMTSALRYVGNAIPADRAFYEAGLAWYEAGRKNMAFVMLNRFLDLSDAMDEPDSSAAVIENADFADTDIPYDFTIPERPYCSEAQREEVRNLVLEISMDRTTEQVLSLRACEHCGKGTYEANLTCHFCKKKYDPCVVTGYPIHSYDRVIFKANGPELNAIRDHWNKWVETLGTDPVTGMQAAPMY
ncbi:intraflagellar protein IFT172 [Volvox carteri f. nagariensis]|uniref:Intraflagellar protein IFT172 n=1 Tax=Volvox carteri f. nagariensis TaxID=3068 RepID=D8TTH3_VOLCA|nr:intraflagellar protein IFT172 [Volvox carteri f. nagariensis]EFJ49307.1 intraflagellar protein IFT172 [Volvox carteri f. nagariensis]|eukprot:XP_002949755.1 intraflagellar protein IFT172 [Volvox carteri f. nagariensis]